MEKTIVQTQKLTPEAPFTLLQKPSSTQFKRTHRRIQHGATTSTSNWAFNRASPKSINKHKPENRNVGNLTQHNHIRLMIGAKGLTLVRTSQNKKKKGNGIWFLRVYFFLSTKTIATSARIMATTTAAKITLSVPE
jgi:hypothetical protein